MEVSFIIRRSFIYGGPLYGGFLHNNGGPLYGGFLHNNGGPLYGGFLHNNGGPLYGGFLHMEVLYMEVSLT